MLTTASAARKDARTGKATMEHRHFADELAGTNPRFDRKRFLAACGL